MIRIVCLLIVAIMCLSGCATTSTFEVVPSGSIGLYKEDFIIYNSDGSVFADPDTEENGVIFGSMTIYKEIQTARGLNKNSTINDLLEAYRNINAKKVTVDNNNFHHDVDFNQISKLAKNSRSIEFEYEKNGYTMSLKFTNKKLAQITIFTPEKSQAIQAQAESEVQAMVDDILSEHNIADLFPSNDKVTISYQTILDDYTIKLKKATPELVQEYINKAAKNTGGITELATICNDKISELAKISNDGIGEMASLMWDNGSDYSEYEEWAGKLQEVYMDEASKITDAYMESAK